MTFVTPSPVEPANSTEAARTGGWAAALGLMLACASFCQAFAAPLDDDDYAATAPDKRAYAYCVAHVDNRVIATDVMKVRQGFTLVRLSSEWTAYLQATYKTAGSCRMFPAKLSKINAYSRLDADIDAMSDLVARTTTSRAEVVRSVWKPW